MIDLRFAMIDKNGKEIVRTVPLNVKEKKMAKKNAPKVLKPLIVPHGDRVLIQRDPISEKSGGGIILPSDQNDCSIRYGTVLEIGSDALDLDFEEGDRVIFGKYAGIVVEGEKVLMSEKEIFAVIN